MDNIFPRPLFDAAEYGSQNRKKVLERMSDQEGVILLKGGQLQERKWTDTEVLFRQESNFFYLTGISDPGYSLIVDLRTGAANLFMPVIDDDYALWHGKQPSVAEIKQKYKLSDVYTHDQLEAHLANASVIHVLDESECNLQQSNFNHLKKAVYESRVIKSEIEITLMKYAAQVTGLAHISVMKAATPGTTEIELQALFEYECLKNGAKTQAYLPIVAADKRGSILHYGQNDKAVPSNKDSLLLIDAGCEYNCYASDVTRTYPVGGKFTDDWKTTYDIVLNAQMAVLGEIKEGVEWETMHRLAETKILDGLIKAGIVKGPEAELKQNHIAALFFPHGIGHLIGIDVHDVGGYPEGVGRINEPGIKYLRMRRKLQRSMAVTVEPGVYFVDAILDKAIADPSLSKYLDLEILSRFRSNVGGVRIEDVVIVLKDGIDNLTGWIPKEIIDIEKVMQK